VGSENASPANRSETAGRGSAGSEESDAARGSEPSADAPSGRQVREADGGQFWVGLLSGTSCDAVDAALVEIWDRPMRMELRSALEIPMPAALRQRIEAASEGALTPREWSALDLELGERLGRAAEAVARSASIPLDRVEGVASHGQTVGHFPEESPAGSVQLGSPHVIHAITGAPVLHDFRSADLAAGGQGAPLTPWMHVHCLASAKERRAVLNLGGFTNVTYLPGPDPSQVIAFDPGPGNALLDRGARSTSAGREAFDRDGAHAARGRVRQAVLARLLEDPYFARMPPKSTGHEHFGADFFARAQAWVEECGGSSDDLFSTLTELTVRSIVCAAKRYFPTEVDRWLIYGGGVSNLELRARLERALAPTPVESTATYGFPHEALEAMAFAFLGWSSMRGICNNLPQATGARHPVVLGSLSPPHPRGGHDRRGRTRVRPRA